MVDFALVTISKRCIVCDKLVEFECHPADLMDWQCGELIQDALPYLSANHREILISQTCGECFDEMFGNCENEEM